MIRLLAALSSKKALDVQHGSTGNTALHWLVIKSAEVEALRALLEAGADPSVPR